MPLREPRWRAHTKHESAGLNRARRCERPPRPRLRAKVDDIFIVLNHAARWGGGTDQSGTAQVNIEGTFRCVARQAMSVVGQLHDEITALF